MTDHIDGIIAGMSEAQKRELLGDCFAEGNALYSGLLNPVDMDLWQKGLIHERPNDARIYEATVDGLAVRARLEASNG